MLLLYNIKMKYGGTMKKFVFLEGLPDVGKTTLIKKLMSLNCKELKTVDEIIIEGKQEGQAFFMQNDIAKIEKYDEGLIFVDRGLISTLSYNQAKNIITTNVDIEKVEEWFEKNKSIYEDSIIIFIQDSTVHLSCINKFDPYGSVENQKLLNAISLYNCKRYCKEVIEVDKNKDSVESIAYEIIDKYLCS